MNATVANANGTITALREPIQADLGELQKTLEQARGLIGSLQTIVRANNQNLTYTVENVRVATDNLNDLTESLKERPWTWKRIGRCILRSIRRAVATTASSF